MVKTIQQLYEDFKNLIKQWFYDKEEIEDLLDDKADTNHNQTSSSVTENSTLTRIGTSANATQHEINLAINNLINTSNEESGGIIGIEDYYIDSSTDELVLEYHSGKLINSIDKTSNGNVDTYTIYFSDLTTYEFTVTNGGNTGSGSGSGSGGSQVIVDSSWVNNSTNPVQSKLIKTGLDSKASLIHTHTVSDVTDFPSIPTKLSDLTNDSGYLTAHQDITGKEDVGNKVNVLSSSSTTTQYPNAKIVYDTLISQSSTVKNGHTHDYATSNDISTHNSSGSAHSDIRSSISDLIDSVDDLEPISNKVTAWSNTVSDTHYPSEKLVKDSLDNKANSTHTHTKSNITDFPVLSTVATSGSYNDLTNKPSIPSKTSDLTNDSNFITSHQSLSNYYTKSEINELLGDIEEDMLS